MATKSTAAAWKATVALAALGAASAGFAQNAATVVANASKAMGVEGLNSVTYYGSGANYTVGVNKFIVGYGQKNPDGVIKTKQASVGYEYSISPRTYLYVDLSVKKAPFVATATNDDTRKHYALGVHHNF